MSSRETQLVRLIGLDLGQQRDYTAISVIERVYVPTGERFNGTYWRNGRERLVAREKVILEYRVRHLVHPQTSG